LLDDAMLVEHWRRDTFEPFKSVSPFGGTRPPIGFRRRRTLDDGGEPT